MFRSIVTIVILSTFFCFAKPLPKYIYYVQTPLVERSEWYCQREMGKFELGKNTGFCRIYQDAVGIPAGASYCYAGQYWCYEQASRELGIQNPLPRTGIANVIFDLAKLRGEKGQKIQRHDFVIWRVPKGWEGHIERVKKVLSGGWVETYAFNVSIGKREGSAIKKRNIFYPLGRKAFRGLVGVQYEK
jgi:hypothetical protein